MQWGGGAGPGKNRSRKRSKIQVFMGSFSFLASFPCLTRASIKYSQAKGRPATDLKKKRRPSGPSCNLGG